jgi:hypothetical protein
MRATASRRAWAHRLPVATFPPLDGVHLAVPSIRRRIMKYGIAWLIGVPPVLILMWFLLNRC